MHRGLRVLAVALALAGSAGLSGCLHVTYRSSRPPVAVEPKTGTNHFFLWGLVNTGEVDTTAMCPSGVSKVDVYESFGDGFLGAITLGIYAPRSYKVWCAQ